eukprot:COSAG02_NODE_2473_length_8740_cov_335.972688_3_plen_69_part_00
MSKAVDENISGTVSFTDSVSGSSSALCVSDSVGALIVSSIVCAPGRQWIDRSARDAFGGAPSGSPDFG